MRSGVREILNGADQEKNGSQYPDEDPESHCSEPSAYQTKPMPAIRATLWSICPISAEVREPKCITARWLTYLFFVVPAGGNIFSGHPAKSVEPDSLLPWDHQFHTELGLAAAKYSRKDADPLAQKFYEKYEKLIKTPAPGFRYDQVYDLKTRKIINQEYLKIQLKPDKGLKVHGRQIGMNRRRDGAGQLSFISLRRTFSAIKPISKVVYFF